MQRLCEAILSAALILTLTGAVHAAPTAVTPMGCCSVHIGPVFVTNCFLNSFKHVRMRQGL